MNCCEIGDCREIMRRWIAKGVKVQMCVTSPPYWGLRDYGTAKWDGGDADCDHFMPPLGGTAKSTLCLSVDADGFSTGKTQPNKAQYKEICGKCGARRIDSQLGLESTPEEYVANMVEVFRLVRDLLADDGTLWLNLGDSYAASGKGGNPEGSKWAGFVGNKNREAAAMTEKLKGRPKPPSGLKVKDLVGIPWRVAFALQADGWYLRQDIIWSKPNPMPESVRDRCTKSHEYLFLLSKRERYYYDAEAIAEPLAYASVERLSQPGLDEQVGSDRVPGKTNGNMKAVARASWNGSTFDKGKTGEMKHTRGYTKPYDGKSTKDYAGGGAQDASSTKARIVDGILSGDITTRNKRSVWTVTTKPFSGAHFATFPPDLIEPCILAGSRPGDIVLDPFIGSGTTGEVAQNLGRQWLGCELNPEYATLQDDRTRQTGMIL